MDPDQSVLYQLFAVILSWVTICPLSIVLWLPVWHQYFSLSMLARCWGYHWIRVVHPAKQSMSKCSSVIIHIFPRVFFFPGISWFSYFETIQHEKYNTQTTILYWTLIQHIQYALIKHKGYTTRLFHTIIQQNI